MRTGVTEIVAQTPASSAPDDLDADEASATLLASLQTGAQPTGYQVGSLRRCIYKFAALLPTREDRRATMRPTVSEPRSGMDEDLLPELVSASSTPGFGVSPTLMKGVLRCGHRTGRASLGAPGEHLNRRRQPDHETISVR